MKIVLKYLFAVCISLLIGNNQLSAHTTAGSVALSLVKGQQILGDRDNETIGLEQNVNSKSLLPTSVEIPSLEVSEFQAEEKHSKYLEYGPLAAFLKPLTGPHAFEHSGLSSFLKEHISFSSCSRYLLFQVFRI